MGLGLLGATESKHDMEAVALRWRAAMAYGGGYLIATLGKRSVFLVWAVLTVAGAALFWGRLCRSCDVQTNRST
jgi:hypothetical protein